MVALSLTVLASSVLALTIDSSLQTSEESHQQLIGEGLAEQLLDEILGKRYMAAGGDPRQYPLTASAVELAATGRSQFDDIDDYNGYHARPIEDRWTQPLGSEDDRGGLRHPAFRFPADRMLAWRYQVDVYYVDDANLERRLPTGQTSYHRAVEVSVLRRDTGDAEWRLVSRLRRVVAYIPQSS